MGGHKFKFSNGVFLPAPDLPNDPSDYPDRFSLDKEVEDAKKLVSYSIYTSSTTRACIVEINTTENFCFVLCETWPDLIELLAKL